MPCARSPSTIPLRTSPDPAVANVGGALALMIADHLEPQSPYRCPHLEKAWPEMDEGIWEVRSGARHFTFSKIMA